MIWQDYTITAIFIILLFLVTYYLGTYIYKVMNGEKNFFSLIFNPIENFIYKICGINEKENQTWGMYTINLLVLSLISFILSYLIIRYQTFFPFNPQNFPGVPSDLALNIALSFLTNTNWQAYGGEWTLSYFSQMFALTPHNFLAPAIGISVSFVLMRAFTKEASEGAGNFWKDIIRISLYILFPLSCILALFYISQGVIQNLLPYLSIKTLEGTTQTIAQGPVASQVAIKILGTSGGGFFNANAAHPFENPTLLTHYVQMFSALLLPSSLVFSFGKAIKYRNHSFSIWTCMVILLLLGLFAITFAEHSGNPSFIDKLHLSSSVNMEGKETRFGIFHSAFFTEITTAASLGATVAAHSSLIPLSSLVALLNMLINGIIFGGAGSGISGMILYVILTVFIAGLMVGRTPEYLGKKIEATEIKLIMVPIIGSCSIILILLALACMYQSARVSIGNPNAHGFSEMFYAFTSTTQNNGSSFASLNANNYFWNYFTSIAMLLGRLLNIIPIIALSSYMAKKKSFSHTENNIPIHGITFISLLLGIIIIVGALIYLPALVLGPVNEHLQMLSGKSFPMEGK